MNEEREKPTLSELYEQAREFKQKEFGFQGLEDEMYSVQERMLVDFRKGSFVDHPGDKGTIREDHLYKFLAEHGYLPNRYGISHGSSRVISTSGHKSGQVDLLIYDRLECPKLMSEKNVQYYPVESVYGVIQIKSTFHNKKDIVDALNNIASFKKLRKSQARREITGHFMTQTPVSNGFGIIFAYTSDLDWGSVYSTLTASQGNYPSLWPNLVVILNQGLFLQSDNGYIKFDSDEIARISNPVMHGWPTGEATLLQFYLILMDLLNHSNLGFPDLRSYVELPLTAGEHSYQFAYGAMTEVEECRTHGRFAKRLTEESAERIISACRGENPLPMTEVWGKYYHGEPMASQNNEQIYSVYVYNPDNIALEKFLKKPPGLRMMHEEIIIDGDHYWLPYYYIYKHDLLELCPKCPLPSEQIEGYLTRSDIDDSE